MPQSLALDDFPVAGRPFKARPFATAGRWRIALAAIAIAGCGALVVSVGGFDVSRLLLAFAGLDPTVVCFVVLMSILNNGLRGLRWHLLTREIAPHVPIAASFSYLLTGFAFLATPGKLGELIRVWLLKSRQNVPYAHSLALIVLDRLTDLVALMMLAGLSLLAGTERAGAIAAVLLMLLTPLLVLSSRRLVVASVRVAHRLTGRRWPGVFVFVLVTDAALRRVCRWGVLAPAMALSLTAWAAQIAGIWLVLAAFGSTAGMLHVAVIYPAALLLGAAAMVPGGADAVLLTMLVLAGMGAEEAVAATLVSRVATWWLAMAVGMGVAPFVLAGGAGPALAIGGRGNHRPKSLAWVDKSV